MPYLAEGRNYFINFLLPKKCEIFCSFVIKLKLFTGNFELPPTAAVIPGVDQSSEGQIVIEKNDRGETRARGFNLQPVVVTDDWDNDNETMATRQGKLGSFVSVNDERGFGLKPVYDNNQAFGSSVESSVDDTHKRLASGPLESRGLDLSPAVAADTEGRGFDLQPAGDALGFSLQPASEARGLDLSPAVVTSPGVEQGGRGYHVQPAKEGRGFTLQPVANLLQAEEEEEEEDDDDTPPPESLQSIKSIARARKSAGKDSVKKSTETSVTAKKTSKSSREKPGKKATIGEKPKQRKEKGKVPSSSVDRSNLFKPSPSSGPSWSPTPTMRESKAKVCHAMSGSVRRIQSVYC